MFLFREIGLRFVSLRLTYFQMFLCSRDPSERSPISVFTATLEHFNIINDLQSSTMEHYSTLQYITQLGTYKHI